MEHGVVDRFEGDYAVVLFGDTQRSLDIPRRYLPSQAREGDWLRIVMTDGEIVAVELDNDATEAAQQRIKGKLERLRRGDHLREP